MSKQFISAYDQHYQEFPRQMEYSLLALSATFCLTSIMESAGVSKKQLRQRLHWSKKKWRRLFDYEERITLKQLSHILYIFGLRMDFKVVEIPHCVRLLNSNGSLGDMKVQRSFRPKVYGGFPLQKFKLIEVKK